LNITDRVETEPFWNPLLHKLDQCRDYLLWLIPFDEMKIGTRVRSSHVRHLSPANSMSILDDLAARRLSEYFGEAHGGHRPALNQIVKHRARTH
jgi:hypothetical protein